MATSERPSAHVDFDRPSIARVTDALLGGQNHYEPDRAMVRQLTAIAPEAPAMAREARQWPSCAYLDLRLGTLRRACFRHGIRLR